MKKMKCWIHYDDDDSKITQLWQNLSRWLLLLLQLIVLFLTHLTLIIEYFVNPV